MFNSAEEDIVADAALVKKRAATAAKKQAAKIAATARAETPLEEGVPPTRTAPERGATGADGLSPEQYAHHLRTSALVHHPMHPLNPASSHVSKSLSNRVKGLDAQFDALKRGEHPVGLDE